MKPSTETRLVRAWKYDVPPGQHRGIVERSPFSTKIMRRSFPRYNAKSTYGIPMHTGHLFEQHTCTVLTKCWCNAVAKFAAGVRTQRFALFRAGTHG